MAQTVGDFIVERLVGWGVRRVFGYPGDGINGIVGALGRNGAIEVIQVRHEEMAAFMACAHAKLTGQPGVCLATSGPGAIHLLNGLYDAKMDHQPVVAIVGQTARAALGGSYQQEVDLQALFKDVAHEFVQTASTPAQVRHLIDRALRIALAERTVTAVIIPHDLQEVAAAEPGHEHSTVHSGIGFTRPRVVPEERDLNRAAEVLNAGKKVAILVGAGARAATDLVIEVADRLGAGIAKALLGKDVVPDDLPGVTGCIGLLGTRPTWELMQGCDTLLLVGTSFPYPEFLPREGQARGVQIDIDGRNLGLRYPTEVNLVGDAALTLRGLLPLVKKKTDLTWRRDIEASVADWWRIVEARAADPAHPINPQLVLWELSRRLPDDAIITGDAGSAVTWVARDVRLRRGMRFSLSGNLATMGSAMPYAIAAKMAYPERPVVAVAGDGAMQMNGMAELITVAKYWKRWRSPRFIALVINNRDLNMVTWEQRVLAGDPKLPATQDLPDVPYARFAESLGLVGIRVDKAHGVGPGWDKIFAADRPAVLEVITDPDVPPLPPHVTWKQASAYMSAILRGDPDTSGILRQSWRQLVDTLRPKS
jgi:pyruvate dehydrogenase (quinone)